INRQVARLVREDGLVLNPDCFSLEFLKETNDIEAELYNELNIREEIIESLVLSETKASPNERYRDAKKREIEALQDSAIIEKMRDSKASYAGYLGVILAQNANGKRIEELLPESVIIAFNKVRGWLEL
ncbi:ATP-dependent endonuclease, partial [Escherichia coli]